MNNYTLAYLILRLAAGASMLGHGLVRLPKLAGFSNWMTGSFQNSMLPELLVRPFSYALPIAEFATGLFLLAGLFTKQFAFAGGLIMILLVFGSCLIENWEAVPSQLIHAAFFTALLAGIQYNSFAIDNLFN